MIAKGAVALLGMFRRGWSHVDAKLIDQRFVKRTPGTGENHSSYQIWEYLVEFADPDGTAVRLAIKEQTWRLRIPLPHTVPVLVNKKRTKAAFNLKDPRIDALGASRAKRAAEKKADQARFDAKLHKGRID